MGPTKKEPQLKINLFQRAQFAAKKASEAYFADPINKLFYGGLLALMVGLFLNLNFPWQLYLILGLLGATKLYNFYGESRNRK